MKLGELGVPEDEAQATQRINKHNLAFTQAFTKPVLRVNAWVNAKPVA